MKRKLLFGLVAAVLVVSITLAGCVKAPAPAEEEAIIIPFGTCSCLSGPYAPWGLSEHWAQVIIVDDINEGGGCWGDIYGHEPGFRVKGQLYKWNLIAYDYKLDSAEAVKVISRLIYQDKVKFMHIFVWLALYPCRDMLTENEIFITEQGMGDDIIGPQFPRTFRFLQEPNFLAPAHAPKLYEMGFREVAIIGDDTADGIIYSTEYGKRFTEVGMDIVIKEIYEPGTTDFTSLLTKAIASNPDLIAGLKVDAPVQGLFCKQARELGYDGAIFMGAPFTWKEFIETAGSLEVIEGVMSTMMIGPECPLPRQRWLRDEYIRRYGEIEWDGSIVDRADPIHMVTLAIEKADSLDTNEVAKAFETMESPELKSFYGDPCFWGGATVYGINHDLMTPAHLIMVVDGKPQTIAITPPTRGIY